MKTDLYTKIILTVIAACLLIMLALKLFSTEAVKIKAATCSVPVYVLDKKLNVHVTNGSNGFDELDNFESEPIPVKIVE